MSSSRRGWLRAGRVGRPHGLDGSFHVLQPSRALPPAGARVVVGGEERQIARRVGTNQRPIVRLAGSEDRAAAEALRGQELLVACGDAPELDPDEWWAEDLEGCLVRDGGRTVGTVRSLLALPSCEVLEVARADGEVVLVPLIRDAVREVDIEQREIDVDLTFLGDREG